MVKVPEKWLAPPVAPTAGIFAEHDKTPMATFGRNA
jgi:hypothetical protein